MAGELPPVRIMVLDNRGVGRSSAPEKLRAYSTDIMAADVLAVMVLPYAPVQILVCNHSMGRAKY